LRRNNIDICADILEVAKSGAKKTQLVYRANLNFTIIKNYLKRLKEIGYLETYEKRYFTTEKGSEFLEQYKTLLEPFSNKTILG
jgi:predicted transcriptional regulator